MCVCLAAAEVIDHNAANYTAWQFRRKCIRELTKEKSEAEVKAAWQQELAYCTELCIENMKNYQVWFHRRACIDALNEPAGELDFIATVLNEDAKNYHAWGHRQWVLKHFSLWAGELAYVESLIDADLRNNSAWNQRHYVLKHAADLADETLVGREVDYALTIVARAPSNSSPWAFLKGIAAPLGYARFPQARRRPCPHAPARAHAGARRALRIPHPTPLTSPAPLIAHVYSCARLVRSSQRVRGCSMGRRASRRSRYSSRSSSRPARSRTSTARVCCASSSRSWTRSERPIGDGAGRAA